MSTRFIDEVIARRWPHIAPDEHGMRDGLRKHVVLWIEAIEPLVFGRLVATLTEDVPARCSSNHAGDEPFAERCWECGYLAGKRSMIRRLAMMRGDE